jgi:hypothetical protein
MMAAAMAMQGADVAPTAREVAACADARRQGADVMARWTTLKTTDLAALNAKRKAAGQPAIVIPKDASSTDAAAPKKGTAAFLRK